MLDADDLVESAVDATGLADFGATGWREGVDPLVDAFNGEADLTEIGTHILGSRLEMLLANRLRVWSTVDANPEIGDEEVEGPLVIIGLPRTGTTALSNLLAADPQV